VTLARLRMAMAKGDTATAIALAQAMVKGEPVEAVVRHMLGAALLSAGQPAAAAVELERAVADQPAVAASWANLAVALWLAGGRAADAVSAAHHTIALQPAEASAWNGAGFVLLQSGALQQARAALEQALARDDALPEAWLNLSHALRLVGEQQAALIAAERAVALRPNHAKTRRARALALAALGQTVEALAALEALVATAVSADAESWIDLGTVRQDAGQLSGAIAAFQQAVALQPNSLRGWTNLGAALRQFGDVVGACACYERALAVDGDYLPARSNLLLCLRYRDDLDEVAIWRAHQAFGQRYPCSDAHSPPAAPAVIRQRADRLRVGLLSADFRRHSVAYFLAPWLAARDAGRVEIVAYSDVTHPDSVTARLRGLCSDWRSVAGWSDAALEGQLRADALDVVIDLAGHTAGNRLHALANHPVPAQVSWLGYPGTTGLPAMDWRLTDAVTDPPGSERWHSERLYRFDRPFLCYSPPNDAPAIPIRAARPFTFGSFNNASKISDACVDLWAAVLAAVPGARMLIKSMQLGDAACAARLRDRFARRGIAADRLILRGHIAQTGGHLAQYAEVDVALDTIPYNGTTTTCEALWMGVPVLTLCGVVHAARVGAMLMQAVGLPELVTTDAPAYIARAQALAAEPDRLRAVRQGLRARMARSPLCDARGFAAAMQSALAHIALGENG
jgi:protein O-GlcNAc transferase